MLSFLNEMLILNLIVFYPKTAGALQLGKNFSLWPEPAQGGVLTTTGVYSLCRHPMYAGLVAFSFGLGFSTDSFTRIALACLLGYVLVSQSNSRARHWHEGRDRRGRCVTCKSQSD